MEKVEVQTKRREPTQASRQAVTDDGSKTNTNSEDKIFSNEHMLNTEDTNEFDESKTTAQNTQILQHSDK